MQLYKLTFVLTLLIFAGCSTDNEEFDTTPENFISLNLETFIPESSLDNTPQGKYVGVIGHYQNPELHGKVFINAGQHNQYNALVQMTNGNTFKLSGTPQFRDKAVVFFEGKIGSFTANFEEFENPILTSVQFTNESDDGYLVVQKNTKDVETVVLTGTYIDSANPAFNGNWDLMGDGTVNIVDVQVTVPGIPIPITLNVPTENVGNLIVSHTGSTMPLTDMTFEPNTAAACITAGFPGASFPTVPFIIPSDIPNPLGGTLGGSGSVSSGGQTSSFNGSDANWSLSFAAPIPAAMIDGGFANDDCTPSTGGTWSWNGRTGTISIDGI